MTFFYVYILETVSGGNFYVGFTEDLQTRLKTHNAGEVPYSSQRRPWRIKTAIAFTDRAQALDFERYLKSSSGRAFAKKGSKKFKPLRIFCSRIRFCFI